MLSEEMRQTLVEVCREILGMRATEFERVTPDKDLMEKVDLVMADINDILWENASGPVIPN